MALIKKTCFNRGFHKRPTCKDCGFYSIQSPHCQVAVWTCTEVDPIVLGQTPFVSPSTLGKIIQADWLLQIIVHVFTSSIGRRETTGTCSCTLATYSLQRGEELKDSVIFLQRIKGVIQRREDIVGRSSEPRII